MIQSLLILQILLVISSYTIIFITHFVNIDTSSEGQRIAPRLSETRQRSNKLHDTAFCQSESPGVGLSKQEDITKPPPGHPRAGIEGFTQKIEPFSVSHHLCDKVECFRVFLVQSNEAVDLPLTCHPSPSLTTFAFRSSEGGVSC